MFIVGGNGRQIFRDSDWLSKDSNSITSDDVETRIAFAFKNTFLQYKHQTMACYSIKLPLFSFMLMLMKMTEYGFFKIHEN